MSEKIIRTAYLVIGPESSGTRFVTGILVNAGCAGDSTHEQDFDDSPPGVNSPDRIVWRRSVPHGGLNPDASMIILLRDAGYEVFAVVTTRAWGPMVKSQIKTGHVATEALAVHNIRKAYPDIFSLLSSESVPFVTASYESLVHEEGAIQELLEQCGLPVVENVSVVDGNLKWRT